ncbi:hypothetical protein KC19_12G109800 [Ceratodon purpureus]|uniref:Protein kinase domain-containing protein n=1 Tax=Ceratodon purpureus TaxID=3225 RepID=A0A8T0G9Y0_CERPU|nr:hypothetical protein KC19_12G109800 [Ceratodon purpureus]
MAEQEYMHPPSDAGNAGLCEKLEVYTRQVNERCIKAVRKEDSCKFNKKQCGYLALKLEGLVECSGSFLRAAQCKPCPSAIAEKWVETFKLMLTLSKQIDDFVQSCCKEEWIQTAMTMTNTSEYVSSLGWNVELCKVACEGFLEERGGSGSFTAVELQRFTWAKLDEMYKIEVVIVKKQAEEDLVTLRDKVTAELTFLEGETKDVAIYLLQILLKVQSRPTKDKQSLLDFFFKWRVQVGRKLGSGATASVYAATWLGMAVAKKVFKDLDEQVFKKEVTNLAPLRHPNITSMFCCKETNSYSSIIMELMDEDLHTYLHNRGEENNDSLPFPILEAVDIMLQVGEGVNYLHNNRIVHRDLKSHNILVKRVKAEELHYGYIHAKVTDFGISIKKDSTERLTSLEPNVGTNRYMPPEVINLPSSVKSPSESVNSLSFPFKCDTYSYGMLCYEILTGHVPFYKEEIFNLTVKENVKKGDRPELRDDLPPMLKALIESCWSGDPKKRPKFNLICSQLRYLKYLLMTGAGKETHEFAAADFEKSRREEEAREQEAATKRREEAASANEAREMAGSKQDVINATSGAAFGGMLGPIVANLIERLKFVRQCPVECRALQEQLERIQPLLENISAPHKADSTKEKWLTVFSECIDGVYGVKAVLSQCAGESPSMWYEISTNEILELRDRIKELVNFLILEPQSACGIVHDVPEKILGMEDRFRRVKSSVLEGHKSRGSSCVEIRGMGGVGKTLLAQMVNNDQEIQQVFGGNSVIWITVGRDAEISAIYDRMRKRLDVRSYYGRGSLKEQRTDLWNALSKRSVLLILDDVWDGIFHECEDMAFWLNIATGPGSVTLVTTRNKSVTRKCVDARESVEIILRLPEEQSWELFCIHTFGTDIPALSKDLEGLAREVCKECDCLPLALKVIGRAMKGKSKLGEWRNMLRRLRVSSMGDRSVDQQLFERLRNSYDELLDSTKICFLYFAAFPEDFKVPVEHLHQIWIAEGLFGESDLDDKAALDEAESAVKELLDRSLIEKCWDEEDGCECVKMHDILRDLAIQMTRGGENEVESAVNKLLDQSLIEELTVDWERRKRVKLHDNLRDLAIELIRRGEECERESLFMMEKKDLQEFPGTWLGKVMKVKRLSLWGNKIRRFPDNFKAPHLKICILYPILWPVTKEVEGCGGCEIGEGFFYNLHALKFLQVCANSSIRNLPQSIGGLGSLQYLNLAWCEALQQLPESIGGLRSLQYLNLACCEALKQLPMSIGGLGSLQHLNLQGCATLKELPESIGGLGSLQHLNLRYCIALKELPESITRLKSLQHLNLAWCKALKGLPMSIGGLGSLQHLNFQGCATLKELPESIGGLRSLQFLNLRYCIALKELPESITRLKSLQHLKVVGNWI